jgi:hypothetical protein
MPDALQQIYQLQKRLIAELGCSTVLMPKTGMWHDNEPVPSASQNSVRISHIPYACFLPRRSYPPWFNHPRTYRSIKIIIRFITLFFPASRYFLILRFKYSPQIPLPKYLQSMSFPYCEKRGSTPIKTTDKIKPVMKYNFKLLAWARNVSLYHRVQNGSGTQPASYPMGSRGSFPGGKAA